MLFENKAPQLFKGPIQVPQSFDPKAGDEDDVLSHSSREKEFHMKYSIIDKEKQTINIQQPSTPKEENKMRQTMFKKVLGLGNKSREFIRKLREMTSFRNPKQLIRYQRKLIENRDPLVNEDQSNLQKYNWFVQFWLSCKLIKVFLPSSLFVIIWNTAYVLVVFLASLLIPFSISFIEQSQVQGFKFIESSIIVTLVVNILVTLNTAIMKQGALYEDRLSIFNQYVKLMLLDDIVQNIFFKKQNQISILSLVAVTNLTQELLNEFLILAFIYCQLSRIESFLSSFQEFFNFSQKTNDTLSLLKILFGILLIGHLFACFWHAIAYHDFNEQTWLDLKNIRFSSYLTRYNYSFYWAIMTMVTVGYGDIYPQNDKEVVTASITMIIACGVFAFSINSIGVFVQNSFKSQQENNKMFAVVNNYFQRYSIDKQTQRRARNYLQYYLNQSQEDEQILDRVLKNLSNQLRKDIETEVRTNFLRKSKINSFFSNDFFKLACGALEELKFQPNECIFKQGLKDDCSLYIIKAGEVKIAYKNQDESSDPLNFLVLKSEDSFGEVEFFTGSPRLFTAYSSGYTQVFILKRNIFQKVAKECQIDYEKFCHIRDSIIFSQNFGVLQQKCYTCGENNHLVFNCPTVHFIADREKVVKKSFFPKSDQQRQYYQRSSERKIFRSLINQEYYEDEQRRFNEQENDSTSQYDVYKSYVKSEKAISKINIPSDDLEYKDQNFKSMEAQEENYRQRKPSILNTSAKNLNNNNSYKKLGYNKAMTRLRSKQNSCHSEQTILQQIDDPNLQFKNKNLFDFSFEKPWTFTQYKFQENKANIINRYIVLQNNGNLKINSFKFSAYRFNYFKTKAQDKRKSRNKTTKSIHAVNYINQLYQKNQIDLTSRSP